MRSGADIDGSGSLDASELEAAMTQTGELCINTKIIQSKIMILLLKNDDSSLEK